MGWKPSKKNLEMTKPGYCTSCGAYCPHGRNTAGECAECHNRSYWEYRKRLKEHREKMKEEGRRYWASRGIQPGDRVELFVPSMLGIGGEWVVGIAKVGKVGAYVSAPRFQAGYLSAKLPWRKVKGESEREGDS